MGTLDIDWETFDKEGYLLLGKVADEAQLVALQTRMNEIMLGYVRYKGMYFQLDSTTGAYSDVVGGGEWQEATLNYRKIEMLERDEHFLRYMQHPIFREITQKAYGEENVSIYRAMFMNKPANRGTILPYHQDGGLQWGIDKNPLITVWTALDPATPENGCMQVIPGSHKLGLLSEHGHTITEEQERKYADDKDSVYLTAKEGEAILLHNWMLHRSGINTINQSRRAFSVCYMEGTTKSLNNPNRAFPRIFGENALDPENCQPDYMLA